MAKQLPPIPFGANDFNSTLWQDWIKQLRVNVNNTVAPSWSSLNFTGSDLGSIQTRNHSELQNILGGSYHVSAYQTGTYTPATTGFTNLSTITGKYTQIGNITFVLITIVPTSTLTSASATITLPITASDFGSVSVLDGTNATQGQINSSSGLITLPSFSGYATTRINGFYNT